MNLTLEKSYLKICIHFLPYNHLAILSWTSSLLIPVKDRFLFLGVERISLSSSYCNLTNYIPPSFKIIVSILDGIYTNHVTMLFPRNFQNNGSYRIFMILVCKMTTSNMMLENVWMNNNMQYGSNFIILL